MYSFISRHTGINWTCVSEHSEVQLTNSLSNIKWKVYTFCVINNYDRLIAIHTFWMFRWQEGLFCNWHDINELVSKWNVQIQTKVRHALVGGPICSDWLVLFSHWSVDFWLIDWLANRISATFFHFWKTSNHLVFGIPLQHLQQLCMALTPIFGIIHLPTRIIYQIASHSFTIIHWIIFGFIT